MDFGLFESDDEAQEFASMCLEPTQHLANPQLEDIIPEFQCAGEDSWKWQFPTQSFLKTAFLYTNYLENSQAIKSITLSVYNFTARHLLSRSEAEFLFANICMSIQLLDTSLTESVETFDRLTNYQRRQEITHFYHIILHSTYIEHWPLIRSKVAGVRRLLNNCITDAENLKLFYFANSPKGNECQLSAYHVLHGVLEWKFLDLCILYKYDLMTALANDDTAAENQSSCALIIQLERVFEDLLNCSLLLYTKKRPTDLLFATPFPCTCFREFWLLLQLALEKWSPNITTITDQNIGFWSLFNKAMDKLKAKMDYFSVNTLGFCEFTNWLVNALTRLYGYRTNGQYEGAHYTRATSDECENYEYYERCTHDFLNKSPSEEQLRIYMCLLHPILLEWWQPNVGIPMLLWDHFHKGLNSSFYVAGTAPSNLAITCTSGRAYLDKYRTLLEKQRADANLSSYLLNVLLLGKMLERLLKSQSSHYAAKLLGRIYSKFSRQKFLTLNETGIHHLIELFLVLALCGDFNELAPKLCDQLLSIDFDKVAANKQIALAKGHMAFLILFAEKRCDLQEFVSKLLQQLQSIRNDLAVSKVIADALLDIFINADDFQRGEHLLIDSWLVNFLNSSTPAEQERTLEAIHLIFTKIQDNEALIEARTDLLKSLNSYILPFLKQKYVSSYAVWLPQLAADFCCHSYTVFETQSFHKLFGYFVETTPLNREALPIFLLKVLQSERKVLVDASTIIQVWLRSLVLLTASNEHVEQLTKIVPSLAAFRFMTDLVADDILKAKEPLCVFVAAVGRRYDACANHQQQCKIADNFNAYVRNIEKWLQSDMKLEKPELLFRFYSFLAIVIYNCPHIVYTKSKITCFFNVAISSFVLPTSIQMGKPPEGKLAQFIHKIWPVLVQGIGRLPYNTDVYIGKTLTELIHKWTPHFKISPNSKVVARPFITCLEGENHELSLYIFEKLTTLFLATQRRQADPNACLVVVIFQEVIETVSMSNIPNQTNMGEKRLEIFMKGTCLLILEHIMMVDEITPSRGLLLKLLKRLIDSALFQNSVKLRKLFVEHLLVLTKKHLAYYTYFYFELLMKLADISSELVEQIMIDLQDEVRIVEQKRGSGQDNGIRSCLHKLQQQLATAQRNN